MLLATEPKVSDDFKSPVTSTAETDVRPGWVSRHRTGLYWGAAFIALFLILVQRVNVWPYWEQDEGTYASQADAVLHGRFAWYTYWYDHPPFGWAALAVPMWIVRLFTDETVTAARVIAAACTAGTIVLTYAVARRVSGRAWISLIAPVVVGTSFITWTLARSVFLDSYATPLVLLGILLALDERRRLWSLVSGGLFFAGAVLTKETFLLMAPGFAYLVWQRMTDMDGRYRRVLRPFAVTATLVATGFVVSLYPLLAATRKEFLPGPDHVSLWHSVMFQLFDRSGSGSLLTAGSARQDLWRSWIDAEPLLVAGLLAAVALVFVRRWRWLGLATGGFLLPVIAGSGYVPPMHVIALVPFAALGIVGVADVLTARAVSWKPAVALGLVGLVGFCAFGAVRADKIYAEYKSSVADGVQQRAALKWVTTNVPANANIVTDGALVMGVVDAGWQLGVDGSPVPERRAIAHEKIDLDPEVGAYFKEGCAIDYIVVTGQMKADIVSLNLTKLQTAIDRSTSVAKFGDSDVREVAPCQ